LQTSDNELSPRINALSTTNNDLNKKLDLLHQELIQNEQEIAKNNTKLNYDQTTTAKLTDQVNSLHDTLDKKESDIMNLAKKSSDKKKRGCSMYLSKKFDPQNCSRCRKRTHNFCTNCNVVYCASCASYSKECPGE